MPIIGILLQTKAQIFLQPKGEGWATRGLRKCKPRDKEILKLSLILV